MVITERIAQFWLHKSGISSKRANKALQIYSALEMFEIIAKEEGLKKLFGDKVYSALIHFKSEAFLERSLNELYKQGIDFVAQCDDDYPECLAQSEVDPPVILYTKGNKELLKTDCVAIVGTRICTRYGKDMAQRIATDLSSSGITIVSGLATGIDMYAHEAALNIGGNTIAVLGMGHAKFSPVTNTNLFNTICSQGLVVSEYSFTQEATKYTFPERNRIISGLSKGVAVIEADYKSGALITADFAAEQGRPVFAVPGNVTSPKSVGTNNLIKNGAHMITSGEDICVYLEHNFSKKVKKCNAIQLDIFEQKIYNLLQNGETSFDQMVTELGVSPQELSATLSKMEIYGFIRRKQSNVYSLE